MLGIARDLIGLEYPRVLQGLIEVYALARGIEQERQCVARDAALVGLDLERPIALRAAIRRQRKSIAFTGGARERWIAPRVGRIRLPYQVIPEPARGRETKGGRLGTPGRVLE